MPPKQRRPWWTWPLPGWLPTGCAAGWTRRNTDSARVLGRLGMRHEAHFVQNEWVKGEWTDEAVYAVLAHEWPGP